MEWSLDERFRRSTRVLGPHALDVTDYTARVDLEGLPAGEDIFVNREVASVASDITRVQNGAGESALGNLIADAQRAALGTDFGFMNPGGIRADLLVAADPQNPNDVAGRAPWGEPFTIQPFGNSLVSMQLMGAQVVTLLEQQWLGQATPRMLQISGLTYTWDAAAPNGQRIIEVLQDGAPIELDAEYSVTVNDFIAAGGDDFTVLTTGSIRWAAPSISTRSSTISPPSPSLSCHPRSAASPAGIARGVGRVAPRFFLAARFLATRRPDLIVPGVHRARFRAGTPAALAR